MATSPAAFTADDMLDLPLPDGVSGYEFVDGRPVPVMPASPIHGRLIVEVARLLANYVIEHRLPGTVYSDAGFVLGLRHDRERMRGPDVAYVERSKVEAHADPERLFRCVPDLAIEIDLTSAKKPGGQQRVVDYLEAGVRLVWAIDPHTRTAMVYRPDGTARMLRTHEALEGEDIVPAFRLPLADLFA
ncbi:MAG: Uma2 family endonuclease [Gemmatimonadetes bacterium]|nr:Uma2 family endonuclease [Gemmatimonadota bacterium]